MRMSSYMTQSRTITLIAFSGIFLSACGGGGSSGSGSGSSSLTDRGTPQENRRLSSEPNSDMLVGIAGNSPRQGSVTQGARGGSNVTLDHVEYIAATNTVVINDDIEVPIDTKRWSGFHYGTNELPEGYSGSYFLMENGDRGSAIAWVMSRVDVDENNLPTSYQLDSSDPIVMGVWDYISDDNEVVSGLFIDGLAESETPRNNIPSSGTATFSGRSYGWFAGQALEREFNIRSAHFDATANLSADWNTGRISGQISDFNYLLPPGTPDNHLLPGFKNRNDLSYDPPDSYSPTVSLSETAIDRTKLGGFFVGDTSYNSSNGSGSGKWGGQFYGSNAEHVGGTWGVDARSNAGDGFVATGVFAATAD